VGQERDISQQHPRFNRVGGIVLQRKVILENKAGLALATTTLGLGQQGCSGSSLKDLTNTLSSLGRALKVIPGFDMTSNLSTTFRGDGSLVDPPQLLDGALIVSQILLAGNQQDGETATEVLDLGEPLLLDVLERVGRIDGEADKNHMRVGIGEGAETVIVLLAGGIPKCELDVLAVDLNIGNVVLKDSGNVNLGESSLGEDDEETGLSTGTITNDNELSADFSHGLFLLVLFSERERKRERERERVRCR
jgi:hypothetical protein